MKGETSFAIERRFGMSAKELLLDNPGGNSAPHPPSNFQTPPPRLLLLDSCCSAIRVGAPSPRHRK